MTANKARGEPCPPCQPTLFECVREVCELHSEKAKAEPFGHTGWLKAKARGPHLEGMHLSQGCARVPEAVCPGVAAGAAGGAGDFGNAHSGVAAGVASLPCVSSEGSGNGSEAAGTSTSACGAAAAMLKPEVVCAKIACQHTCLRRYPSSTSTGSLLPGTVVLT